MKFFSTALFLAVARAATIMEADDNSMPDEWIAVLKTGTLSVRGMQSSIADIVGAENATGHFDIDDFKAVPIRASRSRLDALATMPDIDYIEPNFKVKVDAITTQRNAPYGLAHMSSRTSGTTDYKYDSRAGQNTYAYVLDTGIQVDHPQFEGRATWGKSFIKNQFKDGHGHGTHVAGTIGSRTYGVAKKTNLIAVKVLANNGFGSNAAVISGMQWALEDAMSKGRLTRSVANLSLGGPNSQAMKDAARAVVNGGLFMAVAAGNDDMAVSTTSPANEPLVCTVGAIDQYDWRAYFSNYGALVDVFAPGVDIISTYPPSSTYTLSGTSMATPHVAGLSAYLISVEGSKTPAAMCKRIQELATKDSVFFAQSKNDMIAYNGVA